MIRLFIVGFSREMTESELGEIFSSYGDILQCQIVKSNTTGKSLSYGFIEMADLKSAENAIKGLNGFLFDDRTIEVKFANPLSKSKQPQKIFSTKVKVGMAVMDKTKRPRKNYN